MKRFCRWGLTAVAALLGALPASAHDFALTDVLLVLKSDGTWVADLRIDVDALALGVSSSVPSEDLVAELEAMSVAEFEGALERATETLQRRIRVRFDGEPVLPRVAFPELDQPTDPTATEQTVLGTTARLSGNIPEGAVEVSFRASRAFGVVQLTIFDQSSLASRRHLLESAEDSPAYAIGSEPEDVPAPGTEAVLARYLVLGFEHIIPRGVDHILFVLGLFLLAARLRPLLWQVTAFTAAHTVSLALSVYGIVDLPARPVEVLIALSIAYVGIENLFVDRLRFWRTLLVFGFGLLHGLGFAGVLTEIGLPEGEFVPALVGFNVGVELGQLAVILAALALLGWARDRAWYRHRIVFPLSSAIALTGIFWAIQRAF